MGRKTFLEKLLSEYFNHILSFELPSDPQHQAFPAVFIDQGQDPQRTAIVSSVSHKVIRPDMVFEEGPQPDAGSVIEPEPAAFRLLGRDFQPFLLPDPLNSLVIDMPAFTSQKLLNPSVSITSVPAASSMVRRVSLSLKALCRGAYLWVVRCCESRKQALLSES